MKCSMKKIGLFQSELFIVLLIQGSTTSHFSQSMLALKILGQGELVPEPLWLMVYNNNAKAYIENKNIACKAQW